MVWARAIADLQARLLCHALQFAFKSISYYIRRATLINVRCPSPHGPDGPTANTRSSLASPAPPTPRATTRRSSM
jgi:hypothetical protein